MTSFILLLTFFLELLIPNLWLIKKPLIDQKQSALIQIIQILLRHQVLLKNSDRQKMAKLTAK